MKFVQFNFDSHIGAALTRRLEATSYTNSKMIAYFLITPSTIQSVQYTSIITPCFGIFNFILSFDDHDTRLS